MFNADFRQLVVAALGALLLSAACVAAAIGPVQAAVPAAADASR